MACNISITSPHRTKISKWAHIIVNTLVGPHQLITKVKIFRRPLGAEIRGAKVVFRGDLEARFIIFRRGFQTRAHRYDEIYPRRQKYPKIRKCTPAVLAVAPLQFRNLAPSSVEIFNFWTRRAWRLKFSQNNVLMSTLFCENLSLQALLVWKVENFNTRWR